MARGLILAWALVAASLAFADAKKFESEHFQLNGARVDFLNDVHGKLRISKSCRTHGSFSCEAFAAFEKAPKVKVASGQGGENPGALKCEALGGHVVVGEDPQGDEISFCGFSDESYVDCGSL